MYLGLDLGTTNVKTVLIGTAPDDGSYQVLGQGAVPVRLTYGQDGAVEQDLGEIWQAVVSAVRQAVGERAGQVESVGVSSQGGALQLLDHTGKPLGPVISWLDRRGTSHNAALERELGQDWFTERVGHRGPGLAVGQILRLKHESPGLLRPPNRIGFVGDVIVSRLTGRPAHEGTSCGLTLLYNPRLRDYDPDLLGRLGVGREQLPPLLGPTEVAGTLSRDAAKATGLRAGIPVSPAVHDQYAAALGANVVCPGMTLLGTGTAWVLLAISAELSRPAAPNAFVCHHIVPGAFGQILSMVNGGSAVSWALDLTQTKLDMLDNLVERVPPGSAGLSIWPFLAPAGAAGLPSGIKSRLTGLQLAHGPAHLLRSVIEGLAMELQRHLLLLNGAGFEPRRLVMTGAAGASRITPQIVADVTGLPLSCAPVGAGSVLGAAMIARGLAEAQNDLREVAKKISPKCREVRPGPQAGLYARRFQEYMESLPH